MTEAGDASVSEMLAAGRGTVEPPQVGGDTIDAASIHPKLMSVVFAVVRLGCSAARNNEFMDVSWEGFVCVKSILDGLLEGHRPALLPCFLETGLTQP